MRLSINDDMAFRTESGCTLDIADSEVDGKTDEEKQALYHKYLSRWVSEMIEGERCSILENKIAAGGID